MPVLKLWEIEGDRYSKCAGMRAAWNCHALAGRKGKLTRAIEPDGKGGYVHVIRGVDADGVPFRFKNGQAPQPAPAAAAPGAAGQ